MYVASTGASHCSECCVQGNKKLDKAEILEMTIEYIHRLQQGSGARGVDVSLGQKEWVTDLTTWVIQNKILHTGQQQPLCNRGNS